MNGTERRDKPMNDDKRLIEMAFPLKQASLDSVHEKNVRHGHISTLHIWPARRPLAAARAALLATLLPDPGTPEARRELVERIGGKVLQSIEKAGSTASAKVKEETAGGVLHWGRESSPDMAWFRDQIRAAYGGRAPKVLDPFAGGGAIPLEAMRLGCDVTAVDINPVAWFILKCTLEYPQKLAGKTRPLPDFALSSPEFMSAFLHQSKAKSGKTKQKNSNTQLEFLDAPEADLAWHVRAWGQWVLAHAKEELDRFYPVIDGKPTVAYLWARTVTCKNCRATVPLLKTRWLAKKEKKRVLLSIEPNTDRAGVVFGIDRQVPVAGGNAAQKREHDKQIGKGTMSRSGATCPICQTIMTMEDIRLEGRAGRIGTIMTAVVVDGAQGKEYRLPTDEELHMAEAAEAELDRVYAEIPFGLPDEPLPSKEALGFRVPLYGFDKWSKLFTPRQLLAIGTFTAVTRRLMSISEMDSYPEWWKEALIAYLAATLDRIVDRGSSICHWDIGYEKVANTFSGFRLPISWDYSETNPLSSTTGSYEGQVQWVARVIDHALKGTVCSDKPQVLPASAASIEEGGVDLVLTDPPYYDAIPYSDLMDFFYIWLRRTLRGVSTTFDGAFSNHLSPKWDHGLNDGELIDDSSRFGGDKERSKQAYEDGMFRAFQRCHDALKPNGRLVVVFAHKQPDAWETLVSAIIRAGFMVDASWPIQTEMGNRTRAQSSAALSSSVWLVCKKRDAGVRPGWDTTVLEAMQQRLSERLHDYWDAGIRGPDFVWAATGPALEAYSQYPVVKKANSPGAVMTVTEFLQQVRRIVVDFVVGRVLSETGGSAAISGLDDVTTYYLLHRYDFGMEKAPIGAVILYAISCGLSDTMLTHQWDVLARSGSARDGEEDAEGVEPDSEGMEEEVVKGDTARLKTWRQRGGKALGEDVPGRPAPLIDQIHHLMHLWNAGDVVPVDTYLDRRGLRRHALFPPLLQALIELAEAGSQERAILESLSNHLQIRGLAPDRVQSRFIEMEEDHG
jgi:adenine-specific DNA methylase